MPIALIVTPNIPEAEVLSGITIATENDRQEAARIISALGPKYVVIKGGHRDGDPSDLVFDGETFTLIEGKRIDTQNTHGTGCTFSAAIAANLALGKSPFESISAAKHYITRALETSYQIGEGHSPVNHFFNLWPGTNRQQPGRSLMSARIDAPLINRRQIVLQPLDDRHRQIP